MRLDRGSVRVVLEYNEEGWMGEYQGADEGDEPLLRFWVLRKVDSGWEDVPDASYCTMLSDDQLSGAERKRFMNIIMDAVYDKALRGESIRGICEKLSWIQYEDL